MESERIDKLQENSNLMDQLRLVSVECRQQEKDLNTRAKTVVNLMLLVIRLFIL